MVPTKTTRAPMSLATRRSITTRSQQVHKTQKLITNIISDRSKRKAESPAKETALKRSAFGNLTNALQKTAAIQQQKDNLRKTHIQKKVIVTTKVLQTIKTVRSKENAIPSVPLELEPVVKKPVTRSSLKLAIAPAQTTVQKPKDVFKTEMRAKTRLSNEFDKTDESLYTSALDNLCDSSKSTRSKTTLNKSPDFKTPLADKIKAISLESATKKKPDIELNIGNHEVPQDVKDFDKENWNDMYQVSHYAMDIFNYMKDREEQYKIKPYMENQVCLSTWMRSLLIDWMVEVQESFELNHETLYLGVKLVDLYLSRVVVGKETLQLVGAASMFIASKYDERIPPLIDDFLYICDGAYSRRELIRMEMNVLKICDFNLGIPLSYRFLRRYARCAKVTMPILTLARYVLEYSLMDYSIVGFVDSKLAAAALFLALKMKNLTGWSTTLEFYTGYKVEDFVSIATVLNDGLHKKQKEQLSTVRNKYSHKIFFEVAKTELISNERLQN